MIDIKILRNNYEDLIKSLKKRNSDVNVNELIALDEDVRKKQNESQNLSAKRNKIAKEIGALKSKGLDIEDLLKEVSVTKNKEDKLIKETKELEEKFRYMLSCVPNILSEEVPFGKSEDDNVEVKKEGVIKIFNFEPKEHFDLGANLEMMDFKNAANLSGSRFVVLRKELALLERALSQFMLDININRGYEEYSIPILVNERALFNTGQLPKFQDDLFQTTDNKWLIPTTEVPLTNLVAQQTLSEKDLPKRFTSLSLCFRSEAGSAGKDTKGMLRQHQFYKAELVSIAHPEKSFEELEYMRETSESILQALEIPYRVVLLCSGDIGFSSTKTYDIEVWLPGQNRYREVSSCSNCLDFQARRMNTKIKESKSLVHTLNGSSLAVGRTLIAVLENYQQEDGSIIVPKVLRPYMNNLEVIKK